jgi:hypothetical protein
LDGKHPKPPPKHKPPTSSLDKEEKPFPEHKPPPKGKGEKPPPEHKPPHDHHPGRNALESSFLEQNSASLDGKHPKPPPKHKPPMSSLDKEEKPFPEHKPPPKGKGEKPPLEHKPPHKHHPGRHALESSSLEQTSASLDGKHPKPPPKHKPPTSSLDKEEKPFPEHSHQPGHLTNLPSIRERSHHRSTSHPMIITLDADYWRPLPLNNKIQ